MNFLCHLNITLPPVSKRASSCLGLEYNVSFHLLIIKDPNNEEIID